MKFMHLIRLPSRNELPTRLVTRGCVHGVHRGASKSRGMLPSRFLPATQAWTIRQRAMEAATGGRRESVPYAGALCAAGPSCHSPPGPSPPSLLNCSSSTDYKTAYALDVTAHILGSVGIEGQEFLAALRISCSILALVHRL